MNTLAKIIVSAGLFISSLFHHPQTFGATVLTVPQGGTGASTLTGCLTGNGTGAITGAGTCDTFAYEFTPTLWGGLTVSATSSTLLAAGGVFGTTTVGTLVASSSITNQSVKSALVLNGATGLEGAYGGASSCTNQFFTGFSATGASTCTSVTANTFSTVSANTVFGNATGASAVPTFFATSTFFGTPNPGSVLDFENGIWAGLATSSLFGGTTGQVGYFSGTGALVGTSTLFISAAGNIGIASSSPNFPLSIGNGIASTSLIIDSEYYFGRTGSSATTATSTAYTFSANSTFTPSSRMTWPIGFSATTLTLCLVPGESLVITVVNPNGTAGALTWAVCAGNQLEWNGSGAAPAQTTTANMADVWSFIGRGNYAPATTTNGIVTVQGAQTAAEQ